MTNYNEFKNVLLISMLPGLGKSTLSKSHKHIIDYEDWMEERGLKYKNSKDRTALNHLNEMILMAEDVTEEENTLYVFSSIHWEDMNDPDIKTGLFIHMKKGLYNCEEVTTRGRPDLCDFKEELDNWNEDYEFVKVGKPSLELDSKQFVTIKDIQSNDLSKNALPIKDGLEIIMPRQASYIL